MKPRTLFIVCVVLLASSCGIQRSVRDSGGGAAEDPAPREEVIWTVEEKSLLDSLRASGGISVAWTGHEDPGFFDDLFVAAMDELDLPYSAIDVSFSDFFTKDGEIPEEIFRDPSFAYRPDLLNQVRLYVADFSVLPWREQILGFVPILPSKLIFITPVGQELQSPDDLRGLRLLTSPGTSYEAMLNKLIETYDLDVDLVPVEPSESFARYVAEGTVDAAINDSIWALRGLQAYDGLALSLPVGEFDTLAWAVAKDDDTLRSILQKTVGTLQNNGTFDELFIKYFGMPFWDYFELIGYYADNP